MSEKIKKDEGPLIIYHCANEDYIDITTKLKQTKEFKCEDEKIIAIIENCEDIIEFENNWFAPLPTNFKSNGASEI